MAGRSAYRLGYSLDQVNIIRDDCALFRRTLSSLSGNVTSNGVVSLGLNATKEDVDHLKAEGPEQKVVELYDTLRPALYRYLINTGLFPQNAEEIVQETFLRLYLHMRAGGNEENLRGWIYQVAPNLSVNFHKSRRRLIETTPELWEKLSQSSLDRAPGPEEQLLQKERNLRIHVGLSKLTQLQRDCLSLRVEGFRYREIGQIIGRHLAGSCYS